jgi:hypothetical protein
MGSKNSKKIIVSKDLDRPVYQSSKNLIVSKGFSVDKPKEKASNKLHTSKTLGLKTDLGIKLRITDSPPDYMNTAIEEEPSYKAPERRRDDNRVSLELILGLTKLRQGPF